MRSIAVLILAFLAAMSSAGPALAHRPYFTQVEKVVLPGGQSGELRILNGDGIFFADPARVLALNADGRLIARSPFSTSLVISCNQHKACRVFDLEHGLVLDLDAMNFRDGPIVPGLSDVDRDQLWPFVAEDEAWGFRVSEATWRDMAQGHVAMALENPRSFAVGAAFSMLAVLLFRLGVSDSPSRPRWKSTLLFALSVVKVVLCAFLAFIALFGAFVSELPFVLGLVSLGGGVLSATMILSLFKSGRRDRNSGSMI